MTSQKSREADLCYADISKLKQTLNFRSKIALDYSLKDIQSCLYGIGRLI